jgi:uncharacterized membrane protein
MIKKSKLRNLVSWLIIGSKGVVVGFLLLLLMAESVTTKDFLDILSVITPIMSFYLTIVLRGLFEKSKKREKDRNMKKSILYLTYAVVFIYLVAAFGVLLYRHDTGVTSMENVEDMLGILEAGVGSFSAYVFMKLFQIEYEAEAEDADVEADVDAEAD